MDAIEVEGLTRTFGMVRAVNDLAFSVREGEIFGFLGPNGAGKTTTIRMLIGQLRPTAGGACVAGYDIAAEREAMKPHIGVVWERQNLYEKLSGRDNLLFFAQLFGVEPGRADEVLEQVSLTPKARDNVEKYSNGMKQRLLIARALLHRPSVLFLDEPTRGLDPDVARSIRTLIQALAAQGVTIFLTTHYMEEADHLCHRVAFISEGRIVALDTAEHLKARYGERRLRVTLENGEHLCLALDDVADGRRLGEMAAAGHLMSVHSAEATLEEVFIRLTGSRLEV